MEGAETSRGSGKEVAMNDWRIIRVYEKVLLDDYGVERDAIIDREDHVLFIRQDLSYDVAVEILRQRVQNPKCGG
jgi:hypothetical protein